MKKVPATLRRGVTLPEMLVAVAVTVGMMTAVGLVFEASTEVSGRSLALNEVMMHLRTVTQQLEDDFAGLMPDMPMVIVVEEDPCDGTRMDRIVFFTTGDFQTLDGQYSGNMARVFYGQSADKLKLRTNPKYPDEPLGRVLTRRYKIMNVNGPLPVDKDTWDKSEPTNKPVGGDPGFMPPNRDIGNYWEDFEAEEYQYLELENSTASYWKSKTAMDFQVDHLVVLDNPSPDPADRDTVSMLLRPNTTEVRKASEDAKIGVDALQKLYMLPDVTDFRIEVLFAGADEWFPDDRSVKVLQDKLDVFSAGEYLTVAFYYPDPPDHYRFGMDWNLADAPVWCLGWAWQSALDIPILLFHTDMEIGELWAGEAGFPGELDPWPRALRFSFKLYDRDRRHFPQGKRFEYIVKLPGRE